MGRKIQLLIVVVGSVLFICFIIIIFFKLFLFGNTNKVIQLNSPTAISYGIDSLDTDLTIEDINELNENNVNILYQSNSDIPKQINGKFSKDKINSREDALSALLGLRNIFHINEYDFYCNSIDERKDFNVYLLYQLHNGIPVDGGYFRIVTSKEGEPISIEGIFEDVSNLETIPKISCEDGYKVLNIKSSTKKVFAELVICTLNNMNPLLCWKFTTENTDPTNDRIIFVSATDGNIVLKISTVND